MKHKLPHLILWILLSASAVYSQNTPFCNIGGNGGFTINPPVGCVGQTIQLTTSVPNATSVAYAYHFSRTKVDQPDKKDETPDASYVYQSPGVYTILQYGSNGPGFAFCKDYTVKETRAPQGILTTCGNGEVRLTVRNDTISRAFDQIEVDWGDGSAREYWPLPSGADLILPHQYAAGSANPSVTIAGRYKDNSCQTVMKTSALNGVQAPPSLARIQISVVEMQTDGTVRLVYEGMDGVTTQVLVDNGNGTFVNSLKGTKTGGSQSVTIPGLNPKNVYKFKLSSLNICGTPIESKVVSSVVIESLPTTSDEINSLAWKAYTNPADLTEYQIVRDNTVLTKTNNLSYLDTDVKCGQKYSYQLVAIIQNNVRSYSAPIEVEPTSSAPEVINSASVTVSGDNQIETSVVLGGAGLTSTYDLVVERSVAGTSSWTKVSPASNQSLTFQDKNVVTAENSYCYRFSYTNACKLSSPGFSPAVCSILLKGKIEDVEWTNGSPFTAGTSSYDLLETDQAGNLLHQEPKGLQTSHEVTVSSGGVKLYRVKAYASTGTLVSYSNAITFIRDAILQVPDIFTPNNDRINDVFEVKTYFTSSFNLSIFNRWGTLIFQSNDPASGWKGNDKSGVNAPAGYYVYKVDVQDIKGNSISKSGSFLLVR